MRPPADVAGWIRNFEIIIAGRLRCWKLERCPGDILHAIEAVLRDETAIWPMLAEGDGYAAMPVVPCREARRHLDEIIRGVKGLPQGVIGGQFGWIILLSEPMASRELARIGKD